MYVIVSGGGNFYRGEAHVRAKKKQIFFVKRFTLTMINTNCVA